MHREILCSQKRVDMHSGGVLRQKHVERCNHLILQFLGRKIWIYQVTEIEKLRISPVSSISLHHQRKLLIVGCKYGCGYIKVLDIVYFIPLLSIQPLCPKLGVIKHGDDHQHLLVVFVLSQSLLVCLQKWNIGVS